MKYENLFIDLDDTIWDTVSNGKTSLEEVYRDYNFGRFFPSFNDFYSIYFPNNCNLWKQYALGKISKEELIFERFLFPLRPHGVSDKKFIRNLNDDFLDRTSRKTQLIPHAMEILEYLYPKYKLYILSNGFNEVQYKKINNSGLSVFFKDIILSDHIGYNKPHPEIFQYALRKTNASKANSLMVGDNWDTDIVGAKNSGIDQIWYTQEDEHSREFEPTFRISCLTTLKDIL